MPNQTKNQREYKDFCFRRRYDHFLRFRLLKADEIETYETATELGFKLKMSDIEKGMNTDCSTKKGKKHRKKPKNFITAIVITCLQLIFRKNTNYPEFTQKSSKKRKQKNKSR